MPSNNALERAAKILRRYSFKVVLCAAILIGAVAGFFQMDKNIATALVGALVVLWMLVDWRVSQRKAQDAGAWQRQIDREYRLDIEDRKVTVFRFEQMVTHFEFKEPIEIQYLSRREIFPPLFWKIVTAKGEFMFPDGGKYANDFKKRFVYALPGYHDQRTATIAPPVGFVSATSMWRRDDPFPKAERPSDEVDW